MISDVLVTGASGFTGPYVLQRLKERGYRVYGLGEKSAADDGRMLACDLGDSDELRRIINRIRPGHVIHLAARSFAGDSDAEAFYRVNLFGTINLLEVLAGLDTPPAKVIIASSANVYGANAREVIDETVCPMPVNHYGCSKLAMECMVRTWFDRLPIILTRPFNYTGLGQDKQFLIPKIVEHFRQRSPSIELGNVDVSRDFSDVRDVAQCYAKLLESRHDSEIVNICSGRAVSLKEMINHMQTLTGHELAIEVNPDLVRANEIPRLRGSDQHLYELAGFSLTIPIEDTLRWMYESAGKTG